jgi:predicted glycosyltransferase
MVLKFLIDINHPAHVHFFRNPMQILRERGHELVVTSRIKEMAAPLLDEFGVQHIVLSSMQRGGLASLACELVQRDAVLYRVVKQYQPSALAAIGGTFVAHVGCLTGTPSLVFYDTENALLQNAVTYPFATKVVVPRCYQAWAPKSHVRYDGYHELSYLRPNRFMPRREIAEKNGLDSTQDNFFIRTVSWQANHDVGEKGWGERLLGDLVAWLSSRGKVHISSESPLPLGLADYAYSGKVSEIHHVMAFCRLYIGESATMASESAVLGVPAIYAAQTGRGYTDEQEARYGLVANLRDLDWKQLHSVIERMLMLPPVHWQDKRDKLLADTIDVAPFVANFIENAGRGRA